MLESLLYIHNELPTEFLYYLEDLIYLIYVKKMFYRLSINRMPSISCMGLSISILQSAALRCAPILYPNDI